MNISAINLVGWFFMGTLVIGIMIIDGNPLHAFYYFVVWFLFILRLVSELKI